MLISFSGFKLRTFSISKFTIFRQFKQTRCPAQCIWLLIIKQPGSFKISVSSTKSCHWILRILLKEISWVCLQYVIHVFKEYDKVVKTHLVNINLCMFSYTYAWPNPFLQFAKCCTFWILQRISESKFPFLDRTFSKETNVFITPNLVPFTNISGSTYNSPGA